jgi:formylglycine-generating enzyme required for sulfatase activity
VSSFRLDKYEVTVGRFRQFVAAWSGGNGWLPDAGSGKHSHLNGGKGLVNSDAPGTYETGWVASDDSHINITQCTTDTTWTPSVGSRENLPIDCMDWWSAYAFCIWDGGFLPSEAEWEYAAAGGSQQREYPWGSADPGTTNQYAIYGCYYPSGEASDGGGASGCGPANLAPVGTAALGAGLWGQVDLAGSVWEWSLDCSELAYGNPCANCAALTVSSTLPERSVRSSTYFLPAPWLITPGGGESYEPASTTGIGVRCARAP